jgi:hypothetical protein
MAGRRLAAGGWLQWPTTAEMADNACDSYGRWPIAATADGWPRRPMAGDKHVRGREGCEGDEGCDGRWRCRWSYDGQWARGATAGDECVRGR